MMGNPFDKINPFKSATDVTKQMSISSVVSPLVWLIFICLIALAITSFSQNLFISISLICIIVLIIIIFLFSYLKILFFGDPNLLRSEEHLYNMKALEMLGDQDKKFTNTNETVLQNNPELPKPQEEEDLKIKEEIKQP